MQSLYQSLKSPRDDANALEYRGGLWAAILRAKGFHGGFAVWWSSRPVRHYGCPSRLPHAVPSSALASAIFLDFRDNYRRFERWHVQKRQQILRARHEASRQQLYKELRSEPSRSVDVLVHSRVYSVIDVDPS